MKENQKLLNITRVVSIITVISLFSKLLGMLREVGIASNFGIGNSTDAFYVAIIIPTLIFTSVGVALQNLFMAEFSQFRENNPDKEKQNLLINKMLNILLLISIILCLLSFIFSKTIVSLVAPGFTDPSKYNLTVTLTNILLPTMVIIPLYQIKSSVLRVFDKYISVAVIDLFFNISQLVYLFTISNRFGIKGLTFAILIAYLLQLLAIEVIMRKLGFKYKFVLDFKDKHIKNIFILFFPTVISFGIIQVNELVNKIIASNLDDGSVSALNYGLLVRNLVYNIITLSIVTVIYPKMLGHKSRQEHKEFNDLSCKTINLLIFILIPLSILMLGFSKPIIQIIFERGKFTHEDTLITSQVLFYYSIGIVAFSLKDYFVRVSYSYQNTRLPLLITVIGSIGNIILSIILKKYLGVNGIALSLSLSEILSLIIFIIYLYKFKYLNFSQYYLDIIKIMFINGILYAIIIFIKPYLIFPSSFIHLGLLLLLYFSTYIIIYLLLCFILQVRFVYKTVKKLTKGGY